MNVNICGAVLPAQASAPINITHHHLVQSVDYPLAIWAYATRGHVTSTTRSLNLVTGDGESGGSGVSALSLVGLVCSTAYGSVTHQCKSYTI